MEIVIGTVPDRNNGLGADGNLVRNSLFHGLKMIFDLILDRYNVDGSLPQPWQTKEDVLSATNEREYQEMALMEIARRQKGNDQFIVIFDLLGVDVGNAKEKLPLRIERWRIVCTGYHGSPPGDSLSTDVVRILNFRLMTLTRTIYALGISHLPDAHIPDEGEDGKFKFKFCIHMDDDDGEVHGWRKPLRPRNHEIVSHSHSNSSMTVSVSYFSDEELEEILLSSLSSAVRALPVSPFDECIVWQGAKGKSEAASLISRVMADETVSEFFFGEEDGRDAVNRAQMREVGGRISGLREFFGALARPPPENSKTKT